MRVRVRVNPNLVGVGAPSDDADHVVGHEREALCDAALVLLDGPGVDGARDRAAREDLLLHGRVARDRAELRDGGVRVVREAHALLAWLGLGLGLG